MNESKYRLIQNLAVGCRYWLMQSGYRSSAENRMTAAMWLYDCLGPEDSAKLVSHPQTMLEIDLKEIGDLLEPLRNRVALSTPSSVVDRLKTNGQLKQQNVVRI